MASEEDHEEIDSVANKADENNNAITLTMVKIL